MCRKELVPSRLLLVNRKSLNLLVGFSLLLNREFPLVGDCEAGKFVLTFLSRVDCEYLIFFILIETQMAVIFNRAVGD